MSLPLSVNRCARCGRFRPWDDLVSHFVPDTAFSSEDESYYSCKVCDGTKRGNVVRVKEASDE